MKAKGTEKKILEAGLVLFSKKGYIGATTKEIAKKAGVAELTLFRHFSSKERLFKEIINRYSFLPTLKGLMPEILNLDYSEALYVIAGKFMERLYERRELIKIMHAEIHRYPANVRGIYHNFIGEIFRSLAGYFMELQQRGILRNFVPELGAKAFLGMFFSYFNAQEILELKKEDPPNDVIIREFVGIFVKGTLK
ncbi:MAG: TetR/AcrR family transcriptional regulator [Nitrospirota bacterium]